MTQRVDATFSVGAGAFRTLYVETDGKTVEQVASIVEREAPGPQLCASCSGELSDPTFEEMTGFTLDGQEYVPVGGLWVPYS